MDAAVTKLRARGNERALVLGLPDELEGLAAAFEEAQVPVDVEADGTYPFVMMFAKSRAEAEALAPAAARAVEGDALLWFAYPKGTSKRYGKVDINRDSSWGLFESFGMRPVAQVSIDDDWSAVRFRRAEFVSS